MNAERSQSYADAFYEAALERWVTALDGIAAALAGDPGLMNRLAAPEAEFAQRQRLLDRVLPPDVDAPVRNLLYTLLQRGDLSLLPDIASGLAARARRAEAAPVPVEVVSAIPLGEDQQQILVARLEAQYGAGLVFSYRVDPAILGGLIVRVGDKLIDGSVASKLAAMKQALGVTSNE